MAGKIETIVRDILKDFLPENGLELYNVEYVKEGSNWNLEVQIEYLDREKCIDTDVCEKVSSFLSPKLDELDPIDKEYFLVVSSPGIDRALIKEEDFVRFAGEYVDVKFYKQIEGRKEYFGRLVSMEEGKIIVDIEPENKRMEFEEEAVAKISLAVMF